jgi:uncharacterized protein (TIGR02145 family)
MTKTITLILSLLYISALAQVQQNINKINVTVSNSINQIDSIRFDTITNQIIVITTSGIESHNIADIINVTFSDSSNISPCGIGNTTVTDIDGNVYPVIQIGAQCWTTVNLKTTRYNDGTVIPNVTDGAIWDSLTTPAWCNYENTLTNDTVFGKLYNWHTVSSGNLCPTGWHVPTDAEWTTLTDFLGWVVVAGGKMKSVTGWNSPNTGATNESGFTGLPGGYRGWDGNFYAVGEYGYWWSFTEIDTDNSWGRSLYYDASNVNIVDGNKHAGLSVRCLKD